MPFKDNGGKVFQAFHIGRGVGRRHKGEGRIKYRAYAGGAAASVKVFHRDAVAVSRAEGINDAVVFYGVCQDLGGF